MMQTVDFKQDNIYDYDYIYDKNPIGFSVLEKNSNFL